MKDYTLTEKKPIFKLFPWSIEISDERVLRLLQYFENEGLDVEIQCYEDRDNGLIPLLWVYDVVFTHIIGEEKE